MSFNLRARMLAKRKKAPASVFFTTKDNGKKTQPCVMVACLIGGTQVGPIWGHQRQSIDRALATLTKKCECHAKFHQAMEFAGFRLGQHGD